MMALAAKPSATVDDVRKLLRRDASQMLGLDGDLAFLCGLLHDFGQVVLLGLFAEVCRSHKMEPPSLQALADVLETHHVQAGHRVLSLWRMPKAVTDAGLHQRDYRRNGGIDSLAGVTYLANALCHYAGVGTGDPRPVQALDDPAFYEIGLTPVQVEELLERAWGLETAAIAP